MPQLQEIPIGFSYRPNSDMAGARARMLEWGRLYGMGESQVTWKRFLGGDCSKLVSYAYPDAHGPDLHVAVDMMCFFFTTDEVFDGVLWRDPDKGIGYVNALIAILHEPSRTATEPNSAPLVRAFADLWHKSRSSMSERWQARAAQVWCEYFWANVSESVDRNRGLPLTIETYLAARRGTIGFFPCMDMIERASRFEVPDHIWHLTDIQQSRDLAADVMVLCNDVASLEKEQERGEPYNAVRLLMDSEQLPSDVAIARVIDTAMDISDQLRRVWDRIPELRSLMCLSDAEWRSVQLWTEGVSNWLGAHLDWQREVSRYSPGAIPVHPDTAHTKHLTGF